MSPVVLLGCLLTAGAIAAVVLALGSFARPERARSVANLQRGGVATAAAPAARTTTRTPFLRRVTPALVVTLLERQHLGAGRPTGWEVDRLLALKAAWVVVAVLLAALVLATRAQPPLVLLVVVGSVVVFFVPDLLLHSRGQERDQRIRKELPDTLDQMMIAVQAGLGFDAAMARAAANGTGPLADELTRTLQDVRMGRSRREAFQQLVDRSRVADLRQFVRAILQADAYGISVTDVLRTQADEMRRKRRQRAEEQAQKVPVKVLMPVMLCILPVLFIAVLTPAVISIMDAFG